MPSRSSSGAALDSKDDNSNVSVVIRMRPSENGDEDIKEVYHVDGSNLTVRDPLSKGRMEHSFSFNRIFTPEDGQEVVFNFVAKPLVDHMMAGFNSCCFAYGQTGSGKTHSVFGEGNAEQRGLLARSLEYLFDKIEQQADKKEVGMVVSFLEIYLDQVRDLGRFYSERESVGDLTVKARPRPSSASSAGRVAALKNSQSGRSLPSRPSSAHSKPSRPSSAHSKASGGTGPSSGNERAISGDVEAWDPYLHQDLGIHETPQGLVYVEDLALIPVTNISEVLDVANLGVKMRATYETRLNSRSSRSHTIFSVSIVQKSRSDTKTSVVGSVVNFVDLAGSERLARSQSEGRRFQEAVVINSSLSALGKVVLALASDKVRHIPYRDSKLTRILQNSLGGNSFTTVLTAVDPSANNYEESLNSLFFADRCQNVQNKPVQNFIETGDDSHEKTVAKLLSEIAQLRHQLEVQAALSGVSAVVAPGAGPGSLPPGSGSFGLPPAPPGASGSRASMPPSPGGARATLASAGRVASGSLFGPGDDVFGGFGAADRGDRGASSPSKNAALAMIYEQALDRLADERKQAAQARERVQVAWEHLEKGRLEQLERDDELRKEASVLKRSVRESELEILKCRQVLGHLASLHDAERTQLLATLQTNAQEIKMERESLTKMFSEPLLPDKLDRCQSEAVARMRTEAKVQGKDMRNQKHAKAVQGGHQQECATLSKVHQQWVFELDRESEELLVQVEECRTQGRARRRKIHGELLSVYDLVRKLYSTLDSIQAGMPNSYRTGLRLPGTRTSPQITIPVVGPPASSAQRGKSPSASSPGFEKQAASLAGPEGCRPDARISTMAAVLTGLPEPPLRQDAKEIRNQLAKSASLLPMVPNTVDDAGGRVQSASYEHGVGRSQANRGDAKDGMLSFGGASGDVSWWDSERFAREFCDEQGGDASTSQAGRASLQRLDASRLRALCSAMWRRARMTESEKATARSQLATEVARDFALDDRVNHIRILEEEIRGYSEKLSDHEEQTRNLELALRHCTSSAATCSMQSAGFIAASRGLGDGKHWKEEYSGQCYR
eukprot:TRINITY_DN102823_c0_g1_i1.p1 TRINITY_DN102823_c0_g1~~TRINITY_DN102823_c0_g1_i1.p1  ORF type:complete len:1069 (-),score=168.56 TRINITY_DN102823_c0_g1_i1:305-3511(-)